MSSRLRNATAREKWQRYLKGVRSPDTSAMFPYLARAEGGKGAHVRYPCLSQLINGEEKFQKHSQEKADLLTSHFATKCKGSALVRGRGGAKNADPLIIVSVR